MARNTLALWRFDETDDTIRPADAMGNVDDLVIDTGLAQPPIVDAALGRGRRFLASAGRGLIAKDKISGSTLDQRDCSIQVVLWWDLAAQAAAAVGAGTIYARGLGNGAVERVSAGLSLYVVDVAANVGAVQWFWQDSSTNDVYHIGAYFSPTTNPTKFMMLTATRRWVAPDTVILCYYLGDQLLGEYESTAGDIPGGTTGTTQVGTRFMTGVGAYSGFFDGVIDELRVVDYELTHEEIASTWQRITVDQPAAYDLVKQLHDPGFPISADPSSRVQRETRQASDGLGFVVAQARNARDNLMPDTAYGEVLEQWEGITKVVQPRLGDSAQARRARVLAKIRQRGVSIDGIGDALADLLATAPANLQVIGFTQDTLDDFAAGLNTNRWMYDPTAQWTNNVGTAQCALAAAAIPFDGTTRSWYTARASIGNSRGAHIFGKITLSAFNANAEAGFFFGSYATGDFFLVSIAYVGAAQVAIKTEFFLRWASQGQVTQVAAIPWITGWLHVFFQDDLSVPHGFGGPVVRRFTVAWSTTSSAGPFTAITTINMPAFWGVGIAPVTGGILLPWAGMFVRTVGGASTATVRFDDVALRTPYSERTLRFYVYRDPTIPGDPDYQAAQNVLDDIAQAHTKGAVTRSKAMIAGDPNSLCGVTPCP